MTRYCHVGRCKETNPTNTVYIGEIDLEITICDGCNQEVKTYFTSLWEDDEACFFPEDDETQPENWSADVLTDGRGVSAEDTPDEVDRDQFTEDMAEAISAVRDSHGASEDQAARCVASLEFQTDGGWTSLRSVIANE